MSITAKLSEKGIALFQYMRKRPKLWMEANPEYEGMFDELVKAGIAEVRYDENNLNPVYRLTDGGRGIVEIEI